MLRRENSTVSNMAFPLLPTVRAKVINILQERKVGEKSRLLLLLLLLLDQSMEVAEDFFSLFVWEEVSRSRIQKKSVLKCRAGRRA